MVPHVEGRQMSFDELHVLTHEHKLHNESDATHTVSPGARIKVESRTGRGFTWATVIENAFSAQIIPKEEEPRHERGMRLFQAFGPFAAYYPQHDRRVVYEAGTRIYAFSRPQDKTVCAIPKSPVAIARE